MSLRKPSLLILGVAASAITAASAATMIGWFELDSAPELGWPAYQSRLITVYAPWQALEWWLAWRHDAGFRETFISGLWGAGFVGVFTSMLGLHLLRSFGPLPRVEAEEQPERWGTVRELLRSKRISVREKGIVLGRDGDTIVHHVGDDHVLLIGASRVGEKGVSFVLPTLADCPDSMIVFDPKSELFDATADERAKLGPVYLFDATRPGTHRYNPLLEMRTDERNIGDCRALGMLMTHDMKGRDPFWSTKAADLISGIIRLVSVDGGPRTLERVREIVLDVGAGKPPAVADKYAAEMIRAHMSMEARPRSGVDAQAQLAVAFAGDPAIAQACSDAPGHGPDSKGLSRKQFQVADLCAGPRPVTVYLTMPASQAESLRGLARVVLQAMLLGMLHDRRMANDGRAKRRRVTMLLDEFPSLGHLPFIEHGLAVAAGYNLRVFAVAQSVEQIKETYGTHESIMGNVGTIAWVPSYSKESYEALTSVSGTIIAALRARHRKVGIMDRPSETVSQSRHPMLSMREAQLRSRDEALVFHAGCTPTWLRKARYYELDQYRDRVKDTRSLYDQWSD